jgi:hypothetical protein
MANDTASAGDRGTRNGDLVRRSVVPTLLAVALAALWPALWVHRYHSITALLSLGTHGGPSTEAIMRDFPKPYLYPNAGHDGKFFYVIARHPFSFSKTGSLLDVPAYRYRRILFPLLSGLLAHHGGAALVYALVIVSLCGVGIGAWALSRFPKAPLWLPLTVAADPGVAAAMFITLSDALATGLTLAAFAVMFRRRWGWATLLLVAAVLTRETTVLAALSLACWPGLPRRARVTLAAVPTAVIVAWSLFVASATHASVLTPPPGGLFTFPFSGWTHGVSATDMVVAVGVAAILVAALALPRRVPLPFPLFIAANLAMLICSTPAITFAWIDTTRVVAAAVPLAIWVLCQPRRKRGWASAVTRSPEVEVDNPVRPVAAPA